MLQDKKGYLWFATDNGVSKYDGTTFNNFGIKEGLPELSIIKIHEDSKGRIWCTSMTHHLFYIENDSIIIPQIDSTITPIAFGGWLEDKNGSIWCGVRRGIIEFQSDGTTHFIPSNDKGMFLIFPFHLGDSSVYFYKDKSTYQLIDDSLQHLTDSSLDYFSSDVSSSYAPELNKVKDYDPSTQEYYIKDSVLFNHFKQIKHSILSPTFINIDAQKNIWYGARGKGLFCYLYNGKIVKPNYHFNNQTISYQIYDLEGNLWVSTINNGIFKVANKEILSHNFSEGYTDGNIVGLCASKENIWISFDEGSILEVNTSTQSKKHYTTPPLKNRVLKGFIKNEDSIYFAKDFFGTILLDHGKKVEIPYNYALSVGSFKSYRSDNKGKIYVATSHAICDVTNNTTVQLNQYPQRRSNAIHFDKNNHLWIGSQDGLEEWANDSIYIKWSNKYKDLKHRIANIRVLNKTYFLMSTFSHGLFLFDRKNKPIRVEGLSDYKINSVCIENNSTAWVGTLKGLYRIHFNLKDQMKHEVFELNTKLGLSSNSIIDLTINNNTLWIATDQNKIDALPLDRLKFNHNAPKLYIEKLSIGNNDTLKNFSPSVVNYNEKVNIQFSGIHYTSEGDITYATRLIGSNDTTWVTTSTNFIHYNALSPGEYTFQVKAKGLNTNWSPIEHIQLTVLSPWYNTWWFYLITLIVISGIAYLIAKFQIDRVKSIAKQQEEFTQTKQELIENRLKALRAQMNPHFTFNIMNSIQHFLTKSDVKSSFKYLSKFAKLMRRVLEHSQYGYTSVDEEIETLELYIELETLRFSNKFDYEIIVDKKIDLEEEIPTMLIQPYIENAILHGLTQKKEGDCKLTLKFDLIEERLLKCSIIDNGIGRARSKEINIQKRTEKHKSFGMAINSERLDLLNKTNNETLSVKVIDLYKKEKALGTSVEILIPLED